MRIHRLTQLFVLFLLIIMQVGTVSPLLYMLRSFLFNFSFGAEGPLFLKENIESDCIYENRILDYKKGKFNII